MDGAAERTERTTALRSLPAVDDLLSRPELAAAIESLPRPLVLEAVRTVIESTRLALKSGEQSAAPSADELARQAAKLATWRGRPSTERAINATGVILHTGLGRAPLSRAAVAAIEDAAGYCLLEVDPVTGERQHRETRVAEKLARLTGAEAATVVNNNAGAVLIALAALARGGEVIVSRGELIEIGGSFRIPDVMSESGCRLVEVGATNRTHLQDYERAINPETRALMKVWPSNYRIIGFQKEVEARALVELGRRYELPVIEDLGSGVLVDLEPLGFPDEPPAGRSISAGVDVVTFSGDKLLGGPQAGILVGGERHIAAVRRHPLFRALRPDKLALAALDATLGITESSPERAIQEVPVLAMMAEPVASVRSRAEGVIARWRDLLGNQVVLSVESSVGRLGSGALPEHDVPSAAIALELRDGGFTGLDILHRRLRCGSPPVFARVHEGRLWFDLRTVRSAEEAMEIAPLIQSALEAD